MPAARRPGMPGTRGPPQGPKQPRAPSIMPVWENTTGIKKPPATPPGRQTRLDHARTGGRRRSGAGAEPPQGCRRAAQRPEGLFCLFLRFFGGFCVNEEATGRAARIPSGFADRGGPCQDGTATGSNLLSCIPGPLQRFRSSNQDICTGSPWPWSAVFCRL